MKNITTLLVLILFTAGMAVAQNNEADVTQNTNASEVNLDQQGSSNDATVLQTRGQYHEAQIQQIGNSNELNLTQDNTNTFAEIDQLGDANVAQIFQRSRLFRGPGNVASSIELTQDGDGNRANIRQDAEAGDGGAQTNILSALQYGNDNYLNVDQNRDIGPGYNKAYVEQYGDENTASVTQDGESNSVLVRQGEYGGSYNSVADFTQTGDGNYFETKQVRSYGNTVSGTQEGDDNYYRASVRGSDNTVTMDMLGDANFGSWSISSLGWPHQPADNELSIDVVGSDNYSTGRIAGDNNTVTIMQYGEGNRIGTSWYTSDGVNIAGDFNTVSISQQSDFNSASVFVSGNGNSATVTQN